MNLDQVEARISSLEQALKFLGSSFASLAASHHLAIAQPGSIVNNGATRKHNFGSGLRTRLLSQSLDKLVHCPHWRHDTLID